MKQGVLAEWIGPEQSGPIQRGSAEMYERSWLETNVMSQPDMIMVICINLTAGT